MSSYFICTLIYISWTYSFISYGNFRINKANYLLCECADLPGDLVFLFDYFVFIDKFFFILIFIYSSFPLEISFTD